jgi:RNA polymerase sigma factor (TIGR02999 family)
MPTPAATEQGDVTLLLQRSAQGDDAARDALWSLMLDELRALARVRLAQESGSPTWQPTELVNEVWLKLSGLKMELRSRTHFLAMAATAMRRALIDHAREHRRDKRGGGIGALTLNSLIEGADVATSIDILDLDRALTDLADMDARKAKAIELSYFGGLTDRQVAATLGIAEASAKRDLRSARAWLATALRAAP